mgnify:FL=1|tara:strand:+ start:353 stop:619 length:267 start_codon:yes stop_codon:yes gene_type:complete
MKKENSVPFGEWLLNYKGDNVLVQDLRDDYDSDYSVNFKRKNKPHINNPEIFRWHVGFKGGCSEACEAVKEAAILYGEPLVGWDEFDE